MLGKMRLSEEQSSQFNTFLLQCQTFLSPNIYKWDRKQSGFSAPHQLQGMRRLAWKGDFASYSKKENRFSRAWHKALQTDVSDPAGGLTAQGMDADMNHIPSPQVVLNVLISRVEHVQVFLFPKEDVGLQQVLIERIWPCSQSTLLSNPVTSLDIHNISFQNKQQV